MPTDDNSKIQLATAESFDKYRKHLLPKDFDTNIRILRGSRGPTGTAGATGPTGPTGKGVGPIFNPSMEIAKRSTTLSNYYTGFIEGTTESHFSSLKENSNAQWKLKKSYNIIKSEPRQVFLNGDDPDFEYLGWTNCVLDYPYVVFDLKGYYYLGNPDNPKYQRLLSSDDDNYKFYFKVLDHTNEGQSEITLVPLCLNVSNNTSVSGHNNNAYTYTLRGDVYNGPSISTGVILATGTYDSTLMGIIFIFNNVVDRRDSSPYVVSLRRDKDSEDSGVKFYGTGNEDHKIEGPHIVGHDWEGPAGEERYFWFIPDTGSKLKPTYDYYFYRTRFPSGIITGRYMGIISNTEGSNNNYVYISYPFEGVTSSSIGPKVFSLPS